jgi:site-specific DNA recombinase
MYADGKGYTDIINTLSDYRTKAGNRFGKNSIADILRNEKYHGVYTYNRTGVMPNGKRNNHATKDPDDIIRIPGGIPQIVSDDTWDRVQERLHDNKRNASNRAKVTYLLSGKLICGECGVKFVARSTKHVDREYRYYICGSRDRKNKQCGMPRLIKQEIEQQVVDAIADFFDFDIESSIDELMKFFENVEEPQEVITARKELKRIEKSVGNIIEAIKIGGAHPSLIEEMNRLQAEQERYTKVCQYKREIPTRDELAEYLTAAQYIKERTPEEQKVIIDKFVDQIIVYPDYYDLTLRIRLGNSTEARGKGATIRIPCESSHPHHPYAYLPVRIQRKSR